MTKGLRDPTRSEGLRRSGRTAVNRRVFELHKRLRLALQDEDLIGLRRRDLPEYFLPHVEGMASKVDRTEGLLRRIVDEAIATPPTWLKTLIERAVRRGVEQVGKELRMEIADLDPSDVVGLHSTAAGIEVQGIADETGRRVLRSVVRAVEQKQSPEVLMRDVRELLRRVTKLRLVMLVNTAVVRSVNAGKLFGYRKSGVKLVGTDPEWLPSRHTHDSHTLQDRVISKRQIKAVKARTGRRRERLRDFPPMLMVQTAGDDKVCSNCQGISDDGPYGIDDVGDMIPAHPNCRCAYVPWDDRRYRVNR